MCRNCLFLLFRYLQQLINRIYNKLNKNSKKLLTKNPLHQNSFDYSISFYKKLEEIGRGSYSQVLKAQSQNKIIALKIIEIKNFEGVPSTALREVGILKNLSHHNVISLLNVTIEGNEITLILEYMETDLRKYLEQNEYIIHKNNVKLIIFQCLRALEYCHKQGIVHRDVKPSNLLMSNRGDVKLADFGLARRLNIPTPVLSTAVVSLCYRSPELLMNKNNYSFSIDIWAVGCILFESTTGFLLFQAQDQNSQLLNIQNKLGVGLVDRSLGLKSLFAPAMSELGQIGVDFNSRLVCYESEDRPSASEALRDSYFKTLNSQIYNLKDDESIFSIEGVFMCSND